MAQLNSATTKPALRLKSGENVDLSQVEIKSERLLLTPITAEYAQDIFVEFTPEIARYMIPRPATEIEETFAFISDSVNQRQNSTDLILMMLQPDTREFLGICGLHSSKNPKESVLGLWVKKAAHGHGYGKEAIFAVVDWACATLDVQAFIYPVDRANTASSRIPEALGGKIIEEKMVPTMSGGMLDEIVFRIEVK
jgi:ribosomal-protein-alanine N-acetyltransferase